MGVNMIIKRNDSIEEFDKGKIVSAIENACLETEYENDIDDINKIAKEIEEENELHFNLQGRWLSVENIQDIVESLMLKYGMHAEARRYMRYRDEQAKIRNEWEYHKPLKYLSNDFLKKYAKNPDPFESQLSKMVFYRTYSRFVKELNRRENWLEMNIRVVEYIIDIDPMGDAKKAEELFDNMYNMKVFSSGRIRFTGGTESIKRNFQSAFNCSYVEISTVDIFPEVLYLLTLGSGVGYSLYKEDIAKIEPLRTDVEVIMKNYEGVEPHERNEYTTTNLHNNNILEIVVGDSKTAWAQALQYYFDYMKNKNISSAKKDLTTILFNFDHVRGKGEPLKTFGGYASSHVPFMKAIQGIHETIVNSDGNRLSRSRVQLESIDVLDIMSYIAQAIVSGGVRRSSLVALIDADDEKVKSAKSKLYTQENGKWKINKDLLHRQMSNNTIMYREKPSREQLHEHIETMRDSGEPAIGNLTELQRRKPDAKGVNPCFEILLKHRQHCNLTVANMMKFIIDGEIDYDGIKESLEWATYMAFIISLPELDLYNWNEVKDDDRIIGVSLTGWQDFVNQLDLNTEDKKVLLQFMEKITTDMNEKLASKYNVKKAELVNSMQPAGTVSILPDSVSSGFHWSHSPFYIRRVRINAEDPVSKSLIENGFEWNPENGQTREEHNTKVFDFPVQAPKGKTKYNVSALEQLNEYKLFMDNFVHHNVSSTVHVRPDEWGDVEEWLAQDDNWNSFVGISFLSLDDSFYNLLPYEAITEDEYISMVDNIPEFNPSTLSNYEDGSDFEIDEDGACDDGHCPVR